MDFNSHMRNTAYLDKSSDVRMMYFADHGFPVATFAKRGFGPVVMKDEVEYFGEVNLLERIDATLMIAGLSADGSRFRLRNEFYRSDGKLAARITSAGGWLDLATRNLIAPPEGIVVALDALPRTDDYEPLPSSVK